MKKFVMTSLCSILILGPISAFANEVSCPLASELRKAVNFQTAYQTSSDDNYDWTVVSQPLTFGENNWNVEYSIHFFAADAPIYPNQAVDLGKMLFKSATLLLQPTAVPIANGFQCNYTPKGAVYYTVVASTPARFGLM